MKSLALGAFLIVAASASAQNAYFTGALTASDPTWNRPLETGTGLSSVGTNVFYKVQPFYVAVSGNYTLETASPDYDTFAYIYQNSFSATSPLVNFVGGDDDYTGAFSILPGPYSIAGSGTGSAGSLPSSRISPVALTAGVQYYAINSAFDNGDVGTFFTGIGNGVDAVTLGTIPVPEPASMLALGVGALLLARRRRKA